MEELEEKIYNGFELAEEELSDAVFELENIDEIKGDCGRWNQSITTILKVKDKLFAIKWERGLTEFQEHLFNSQPYEVEKKTRVVEEAYYDRK